MTVSLLAAVRLPDVNGMIQDEAVNTFNFETEDLTNATAIAAIGPFIEQFYISAYDTNPVAFYLDATRSRGANVVKVDWFDIAAHLDGSPHGSPVATSAFTLSATAGIGPLPQEVAVCASYHATPAGLLEAGPVAAIPTEDEAVDQGAPATHLGRTRPKARSRGRIYLGPLDRRALEPDGTGHPEVWATMRNDVAAAMHHLRDNMLARATTGFWTVWSRRNAAQAAVEGGFVDNEFDVVRRRRRKATTRTLWP